MTSNNPEQLIEGMNLSNILVSILATLKEINVPVITFLDSNKENREMKVTYDSDTESFTFRLKDKDLEEKDLVNDFE
jgi:hypothetical protein